MKRLIAPAFLLAGMLSFAVNAGENCDVIVETAAKSQDVNYTLNAAERPDDRLRPTVSRGLPANDSGGRGFTYDGSYGGVGNSYGNPDRVGSDDGGYH